MKVVLTSIFILVCCAFVSAQGATRETGIEHYRTGNYEKAVEDLDTHILSHEKDKLAWLYLGASSLKLGRNKDAVRAFRKSNLTLHDSLGPFDTDLKIMRKPRAGYTNNARQNLVTGIIKIAVEFKADGTIGFAFPFETLPDGLTENSVRAARSIEFQPAIRKGKPVDVVSVITYSFAIY